MDPSPGYPLPFYNPGLGPYFKQFSETGKVRSSNLELYYFYGQRISSWSYCLSHTVYCHMTHTRISQSLYSTNESACFYLQISCIWIYMWWWESAYSISRIYVDAHHRWDKQCLRRDSLPLYMLGLEWINQSASEPLNTH